MWNFSDKDERTAIIDDRGQMLSYGELEKFGEDLCKVIGTRCMVFLFCKNCLGSLIGYIGFINGGIVPAMLKADLDEDMLNCLYQKYHPSYLWIGESNISYSLLQECKKVYECFEYILYKTPYAGTDVALYDELALLLTTSGSTGSPKFVRQSYKNMRANIENIVSFLKISDTERPITTLPINYTYGLSVVNTHLDVGATILLTDKSVVQKEFWDFFMERRATSFSGVPYTYETLNRMHFTVKNYPSLRYMTQSGGKLRAELHQAFAKDARESNKKFVVMYGQCEGTAVLAYVPVPYEFEKVGSMGIAVPNGRMALIDVQGNEIEEANTNGEIVYYGDDVTLGYAECLEDLCKGDERAGCLKTGDIAYKDKDGFFYFAGRRKRFLKILGNRISLDEVEQILKVGFPDMDVACAGVDDQMDIFYTKSCMKEEIQRFLLKKTGLHRNAFRMIYLENIPKNESGKTLYKELMKQ
ncbi:MAG: AMP-binding protein [Blautia sp.]|nr:AMP-binding protein [Blautia sp.]